MTTQIDIMLQKHAKIWACKDMVTNRTDLIRSGFGMMLGNGGGRHQIPDSICDCLCCCSVPLCGLTALLCGLILGINTVLHPNDW